MSSLTNDMQLLGVPANGDYRFASTSPIVTNQAGPSWSLASAGQCTISWTPNTPGFVLQETWVLSPANWTNSPSGATNPITVPALLPTKYYRLFKP